jgi:hypothetical protein
MPKIFTNMDALIARSDFAANEGREAATQSLDNFEKILLRDLVGSSNFLYKLLRKPDFQRETTQWSPQQIATLIESFLNGELIPAVILWKSSTNVFVIDGGHRLSALLAWANDDYGDGPLSYEFFNRTIPTDQKRSAERTRKEIASRTGTYQHFASRIADGAGDSDLQTSSQMMNFATRGIQVQWITGDADKAESSFFKINTQGSVLDATESRILKNRRKAPAILARSVVRAATGNEYWSKFSAEIQTKIRDLSRSIHRALFSPELSSPVRTLDLPLGGSAASTQALNLLINLAEMADGQGRQVEDFDEDGDGMQTVLLLTKFEKIVQRMVGNGAASLGLHPLIYFYTSQGRHYDLLLQAVFSIIGEKIKNNDSAWFKTFSEHRGVIESNLNRHKTILTLLISALGSGKRLQGAREILDFLIEKAIAGESEIIVDDLAEKIGLQSRLYSIRSKPGVDFSDDVKTSVFLKNALANAIKCPICGGYLDPAKSASYDHIERKQDGGNGAEENCQLTHPYCNTSIKN